MTHYESMQAAMEQARKLMPTDVPDVYVMTYRAEQALRKHFETDKQPGVMPQPSSGFWADRVCGIPFESYPTLKECHDRVLELRDEGKNVAMVGQ